MKRALIYSSFLIAIIAGLTWFFMTHEQVPDRTYTGFRGEARVNDYLAAEMLLNELGVEADSLETLTPSTWMPLIADTLVVTLSAGVAVGGERIALEDWVRSGGHLVLLLPMAEESAPMDEFLADLGFGLEATEPDDEATVGKSIENLQSFDYSLSTAWLSQRIQVLDPDSEAVTLTDKHGIIAARTEYGSGFLTVVSSEFLFNNHTINTDDHGRFLLDVVDGFVEPGKVWFVFNSSFVPLWKLIWNNAQLAVISAFILLFVSLWAAMPSFGPEIGAQDPSRRSIIEHIRAAGIFTWKQHGASALLRGAAKSVLHEAESRHPGIGRLSPAKQAEKIAQISGLDAQAILDVLAGQSENHPREFTHHIDTLQQIRKEL